MSAIALKVNGQTHAVDVDPATPLLCILDPPRRDRIDQPGRRGSHRRRRNLDHGGSGGDRERGLRRDRCQITADAVYTRVSEGGACRPPMTCSAAITRTAAMGAEIRQRKKDVPVE